MTQHPNPPPEFSSWDDVWREFQERGKKIRKLEKLRVIATNFQSAVSEQQRVLTSAGWHKNERRPWSHAGAYRDQYDKIEELSKKLTVIDEEITASS